MELTIVLQNKTPIFSAAPGASTITLDNKIGTPNGFPFTRQRTMQVPQTDESGVTKLKPLPIVPSNTLRNLIRRSALESIFERFQQEGSSLTVGAYAAACSGSASGNPEGVPATFDETFDVRQHPFLGLFGGGPRMIRGRLRVDSMYPITWGSQAIIGDGYEELMVNGKLLDVVWTRRVDPVEKADPDQAQQRITDAKTAITQWALAGVENKAKKKKAQESDSDTTEKIARGLNAFNAHEVVAPGIHWVWKVRLENPTNAQVGLVLSSIINIAENQMAVAGGHSKDYGQVDIKSIHAKDVVLYEGAELNDDAHEYMDAFAEALDGMSTDEFERFVKAGGSQ